MWLTRVILPFFIFLSSRWRGQDGTLAGDSASPPGQGPAESSSMGEKDPSEYRRLREPCQRQISIARTCGQLAG
jgi:hypothetical protein